MKHLTAFSILLLLVIGCTETKFDARLETWNGIWADGTGYELTIEEKEGKLHLSRTGDVQSQMTILGLSKDFKRLSYEEKNESTHYRHTLELQSTKSLSDEWLNLKTNTVWTTSQMNKIIANKSVDTTPASAPR